MDVGAAVAAGHPPFSPQPAWRAWPLHAAAHEGSKHWWVEAHMRHDCELLFAQVMPKRQRPPRSHATPESIHPGMRPAPRPGLNVRDWLKRPPTALHSRPSSPRWSHPFKSISRGWRETGGAARASASPARYGILQSGLWSLRRTLSSSIPVPAVAIGKDSAQWSLYKICTISKVTGLQATALCVSVATETHL